jgi:hypothetical protein
MAYCLLGVFDVNMPLLFGESHRAFQKLQFHVFVETEDLTLFAWEGPRSWVTDGARNTDFDILFATSLSYVYNKPNLASVKRLIGLSCHSQQFFGAQTHKS